MYAVQSIIYTALNISWPFDICVIVYMFVNIFKPIDFPCLQIQEAIYGIYKITYL